ncbi:MAG: hypothetical protein JST85_27730 [Acidobacteria bacterium]|nr:hypothetical protein [Acidobacteriota bacterium]
MKTYFFLLLFCTTAFQNRHHKYLFQNQEDIYVVTYCDLIKEPKKYDGKLVRVKASVYVGYHGGFFYDLACDGKDKRADLYMSCGNAESCKSMREALSKDMNKKSLREDRVELVIKGIFRGPGNYGSVSYDQQGFYFRLEMKDIEKSAPIPNDVPWPSTSK